jgi:hypothetical protein
VAQFVAREDPVLTPDAHGWRQLVHFAATPELIRDDFDDTELRGKHFMTAVETYCQRSTLIMQHDLTGYGAQPTLVNQHELAGEYFGRLHQHGVAMLGSGASFHQICFSAVARRNLSGADAQAEPDPRSLCTFLSQLFAAGNKAEQGRPFRAHNTAAQLPNAPSSANPPLPAPVPEDVRQRIHSRALQLVPAGLPETMVSAAFNATATHTEGSNFYYKNVDRLRKLGGTMVNDAVRAVSESQFVVVSGKRAAGAWISLVHEAIRHCTATRGNARCLNLQSDVIMLQVTFAVITRQFTSKGFSLHLLVPQVPGLPSPKKIKELLGEAAQGLVGSLFTAATSPEEAKGEVWNILLMSLQQLLVLVFADFDFGFSIVVIFYIDHVPMFQSNALPFCMVTREIAKFFEESQRQRTITLQHTAATPSEVLSYVEPEDLRRSRMALLDWNRETQALQDVQFQRSYDMAVQRGLLRAPANHSDRNRNRNDGNPNGQRNNRRDNDRRGKGGGKGKGKGGKGGSRSDNDPHGMDKSKWAAACGAASNGKKLCWWFSHGNKPCSRSPCAHVHAHPDKYNGKHFKDLSKSEQMAVMAACKE